MHTVRLSSLKTKSWWVISSATAFVFSCFFLYFCLIHCGEAWGEGGRSRAPSDQGEPKKGETPQLRCGDAWQKGGKGKERRTCSDSIAKAGLSLSLFLFVIIYYLLFCHSFFFLIVHQFLVDLLVLSWTFFFFLLGLPLALFIFCFLFFFKLSQPVVLSRGELKSGGGTNSFFLLLLFVSLFVCLFLSDLCAHTS